MKKIETERLILRLITEEDASDSYEWLSDKEVNRYMLYPLYTNIEDAKKWLSSLREEDNVFAYVLKDNNKVIGAGSLTKLKNGKYELGYNLNKRYWGKGYGTEGAKALIDYAHTELGAKEFVVSHVKENERSKSIILKCGFKYLYDFQTNKMDNSESFDCMYYEMSL